ncbi:unnamed protein product [Notodromas monacha]|uniref:Peptidase S1 domain-containing protein n=1 Tax=Notodromas monacha TaxID=399045 RepID=A0A7R9BCF0_9CRUS|nr:unnamed protein product [Notodromas monacha]CAG0912669.1 unnamed protein product [Notodromas monacha]
MSHFRFKSATMFAKVSVGVILMAACAAALPWDGIVKRRAIVGGENAEKAEFPFQAAIWEYFFGIPFFTCGGSVLNENYILTAGHCCTSDPTSLSILVGANQLYFPEETKQDATVAQVIQHEDYNGNTVLNDICLLKLNEALVWTDTVQPVILPDSSLNITEGDLFVVSGWGATSEGGILLPNDLQKVTVPYVADDVCDEAYGGNAVAESMVCAGDLANGGIDSCQGDSGGPMTLASDKRTLVGIVSWGQGCARPGYPGVYTEVSYFLDWIAANAV